MGKPSWWVLKIYLAFLILLIYLIFLFTVPEVNSFLVNALATRRAVSESRAGYLDFQGLELEPREEGISNEIIDTTIHMLSEAVGEGHADHETMEEDELRPLAPVVDGERTETKEMRPKGGEVIVLSSEE